MSDREKYLKEAAEIVRGCGDAARNGAFGDEWTSRDIRDAMHSAASVVVWMADHPEVSLLDALQDSEDF